MKRSLLIGAAACAIAVMPILAIAATPRTTSHAVVTSSDNAVVLVQGDHGADRGRALSDTARVGRDRDDAWSRGLRRFRSSFD